MGILGNSIQGQDRPVERVLCLEDRIEEILSSRDKTVLSREGVVTAAVLVALFKKRTGYHVLLTRRSEHVEHHKGEISFPGGKLDDTDPDLVSCALRETYEEIGVRPGDVRVLGELDDVYTFATGYLVAPFVGVIPHPYEFTTNKREIAEVLTVPLKVFFDPSRKREGFWDWNGRSVRMVFYSWNEHTIWGATARILDHFSSLLTDPDE